MTTTTTSALRDQAATLVSRLLDPADPLTLEEAQLEAWRLAGEVFDAAAETEQEARQ